MKTCALILCIALTLAGCKSHTDDTPPAPVVAVKIAKVEAADLQLSVRAPAVIFPRQQASVSSRIAARVRTLNARKGDQVSAGQTLAQLENSDLIAQRDEAKAVVRDADASLQKMTAGTLPTEIERARGQVLTAKATLDQAQKVYDRRKQLFDQGAIPQRELLVSETDLTHAKVAYDVALKSLELLEKRSREKDVEIAESRLDQAKARLAEINAQLEFTQIRSPFAGVITEQFMFTGDMARPDAPIFTVMDLSVAIARAQVPESEGRFIRQGQSGVFTPADAPDESFAGLITVVNQAIDPARRTIEVWCEIPNPKQSLRAGVFGSLSIVTGEASHSLVVPVGAVQFSEETGKGKVMVVDDLMIAHEKEVETGEVIEGRVRILSGLDEGEKVIVEGGYGLPDGTQVRVESGGQS